jgi:hypothetical protein
MSRRALSTMLRYKESRSGDSGEVDPFSALNLRIERTNALNWSKTRTMFSRLPGSSDEFQASRRQADQRRTARVRR